MQTIETEDFLAHYGIKGMKWGVRRTDAQLERASSSGRSSGSESSDDRPKRQINKKHVAIAAGVVGAAAAITVTAVVASNQKKAGQAAVAAQIQSYAKKSMWEIAASNPQPPPSKKKAPKSSYSNRDMKKDTKLYGEKGAKRIQKRVDKGEPLSSARQKEVIRKYGGTAAKVAYNVGSAKAKENIQSKFKK